MGALAETQRNLLTALETAVANITQNAPTVQQLVDLHNALAALQNQAHPDVIAVRAINRVPEFIEAAGTIETATGIDWTAAEIGRLLHVRANGDDTFTVTEVRPGDEIELREGDVFMFIPPTNKHGSISLTYALTDGDAGGAQTTTDAEMDITIASKNDPISAFTVSGDRAGVDRDASDGEYFVATDDGQITTKAGALAGIIHVTDLEDTSGAHGDTGARKPEITGGADAEYFEIARVNAAGERVDDGDAAGIGWRLQLKENGARKDVGESYQVTISYTDAGVDGRQQDTETKTITVLQGGVYLEPEVGNRGAYTGLLNVEPPVPADSRVPTNLVTPPKQGIIPEGMNRQIRVDVDGDGVSGPGDDRFSYTGGGVDGVAARANGKASIEFGQSKVTSATVPILVFRTVAADAPGDEAVDVDVDVQKRTITVSLRITAAKEDIETALKLYFEQVSARR